MSRKNKDYLREYRLKIKKEALIERSINDLIQNYSSRFTTERINLRIIFSPIDYPHNYEKLDFNEWEFNDFFNDLIHKRYSVGEMNNFIQFFDPRGEIMDWKQFNYNPIPEYWYCIKKRENIDNSIVIKNDGVIYFNSSQNYSYEDKSVLNLTQLEIYLKILINQIIPNIYENLNYIGKLSLKIDCFGINNSYLLERSEPPTFKEPKDQNTIFENSYVLNLENPISIHLNIINNIRKYFKV